MSKQICKQNTHEMSTVQATNKFLTTAFARIFDLIKTRVMITKLTLTLNQQVIESAKAYAKRNGKSLSSIVESYLRSLEQTNARNESLAPEVKRLLGSVKLSKNFKYINIVDSLIIS